MTANQRKNTDNPHVQAAISSELISRLLALPGHKVWMDYNSEADVLYISFRKPQQANDSVMEDDGNIYHYRDDELVEGCA